MSVQSSALALPEPDEARSDLTEFVRSTPAKFLAVGIAAALSLLAAVVVTTSAVTDRQHTLDALLSRTEPLSDAAQNLYSQLSVADAAAATAFISGGLEPAEVRDRYSAAIQSASSEVVRASTGLDTDDTRSKTLLADIAANLPLYTGLIETARTNNRVGNPVGAAYLAEASALMQNTILPWAEELHSEKAGAVTSAQREFATPPWRAIATLVLALIVLAGAQIYLARRTRRSVNPGLAIAAFAMLLLLGWILVAGLISATSTNRALVRGAEPLEQLTSSRILAQQARADETIGMARRGGSTDYEKSFTGVVGELSGALDDLGSGTSLDQAAVDDAKTLLGRWTGAHERMNEALAVGDFGTAVAVATGPAPGDSSDAFGRLDSRLEHEIDASRDQLRTGVDRAESVLAGLGAGALVLTGVAALGVVVGLWVRLQEYG